MKDRMIASCGCNHDYNLISQKGQRFQYDFQNGQRLQSNFQTNYVNHPTLVLFEITVPSLKGQIPIRASLNVCPNLIAITFFRHRFFFKLTYLCLKTGKGLTQWALVPLGTTIKTNNYSQNMEIKQTTLLCNTKKQSINSMGISAPWSDCKNK